VGLEQGRTQLKEKSDRINPALKNSFLLILYLSHLT
jgi:hypothetical protein